jgi:hypothetical protein
VNNTTQTGLLGRISGKIKERRKNKKDKKGLNLELISKLAYQRYGLLLSGQSIDPADYPQYKGNKQAYYGQYYPKRYGGY